MLTLESPLTELRGIGPKRAAELAAVGASTVRDLLFHLPSRYEDRRLVQRVGRVAAAGPATLHGRLHDLSRVRLRRRRLTLVRGKLSDASGTLAVVWFNRPYLPRQVDLAERYALHGEVRPRGDAWELVNPTLEPLAKARESGTVVPVYPALGPLGAPRVRHLVAQILDAIDLAEVVEEPLPPRLLERHDLPPLGAALARVHRPGAEADPETLGRDGPAFARLIYGELLNLQLRLAVARAGKARVVKSHSYRVDERLRSLVDALPPFELTGAQRRVVEEIISDLARPAPMLRLLQGDVGSGKTVVAALAMAVALESSLQAAIMAPTELLAEQHLRSLGRLFGDRYSLCLLTGSSPTAAADRRRLACGETQVAIGTHALFQERVEFDRLGLTVIDEQHRFGVAQRQRLQRKGRQADLLVMTATPIPRSLALTVYGDLDSSVLDELPPGRTPVTTRVEPLAAADEVYAELAERLAAGEQAYVVLPLIEESAALEVAAIEGRGAALERQLAEFAPAVLHGRTPRDEREARIAAFARGEIGVLIATTVIEVGVDVPRASLMVIENAERFGLSQLHQLRGRVGRGARASTCIALHGRLSDDGRRRLEVFGATTDGFRIAEQDLAIRGPGDVLGTRQSGLPRLRIADLVDDRRWLERARADAAEVVASRRAGDRKLVEAAGRRVRRAGLAGG